MAVSRKSMRKPKSLKLYSLEHDYRMRRPPGWKMENIDALGAGRVLYSPRGKRSFPPLAETPRMLIDKSLGRSPVDWERCDDFLLISDRMKSVLEAVDKEGVAFLRCETRLLHGGAAPVYWICDVVRLLDVVDEEQSNLEILEDGTDYRHYGSTMSASVVFREEAIGSAHIFRLRFAFNSIICDQAIKDAFKAAGLKGMRFGNAYGDE